MVYYFHFLHVSSGSRRVNRRNGEGESYMNLELSTIRFVTEKDRGFWFSLDRHLRQEEFSRKVRDRFPDMNSRWN